jgi:hypothetical protein
MFTAEVEMVHLRLIHFRVPRQLEEPPGEDLRRDHFLVSVAEVEPAHMVDQEVVHHSAFRQEERAAWGPYTQRDWAVVGIRDLLVTMQEQTKPRTEEIVTPPGELSFASREALKVRLELILRPEGRQIQSVKEGIRCIVAPAHRFYSGQPE